MFATVPAIPWSAAILTSVLRSSGLTPSNTLATKCMWSGSNRNREHLSALVNLRASDIISFSRSLRSPIKLFSDTVLDVYNKLNSPKRENNFLATKSKFWHSALSRLSFSHSLVFRNNVREYLKVSLTSFDMYALSLEGLTTHTKSTHWCVSVFSKTKPSFSTQTFKLSLHNNFLQLACHVT